MTRTSRTTAIAVLLMGMAATPSTSFSFPNSSLWRERYVGHHQVEQPQENQQPDYYRILGVGRQASQDDIKTAFRQLVKQYHPDANPNTDTTEQFQTINKAYHILIDPQKRLKYNSQTCHYGLASDTPHFIMDAFETDTYAQQKKSTADTDAVRYQPMQLEPNDNGRGSLFQKDDKEDQANPYRISSY